jgi:murein DD-endopeptidase MepM/ murein hydrolase activator NlpD
MGHLKVDGLVIVAVLFSSFMLSGIYRDWSHGESASGDGENDLESVLLQNPIPTYLPDAEKSSSDLDVISHTVDSLLLDHDSIQMPYADYALTQGVHGYEYGHLAIDITAGKGAEIKSPINGQISASFTDPVGSTILMIENERWQITLVHGIFSVSVGDFVRLGQVIGIESNQGNTVDLQDRSCRGRDCGYHTHINIFDKRSGMNVNPLDLFPD